MTPLDQARSALTRALALLDVFEKTGAPPVGRRAVDLICEAAALAMEAVDPMLLRTPKAEG